jgi:formate hydrogenlyase subunit 6/NADH:ubiquinone oxidoreductase subunit I
VRVSIFSSIVGYVRSLAAGARSVWESCWTAVPYLFSAGEYRKEVTEQYPDPISSKTVDDLPPRSRGLLRNDIDLCTGCRDCEQVCPTQCIRIETDPGADTKKIWVSIFDIDHAQCVFCGLCVEACQPASLTHTKNYESAVEDLTDLVAHFGRGKVTSEQRAKWASMRKLSESDEGSY